MSRYDHTIELPVDAAEAVKQLQRELRAAKSRLSQSRHETVFAAFRSPLVRTNVSGRS
ncbi:hypothetical protein [Gryllotalpicola daejeonensis]|jgi:hypothetical protein